MLLVSYGVLRVG